MDVLYLLMLVPSRKERQNAQTMKKYETLK